MPPIDYLAPEIVASFLTLTFLEIVLAGDNLVLIAILAGRLPEGQRPLARRVAIVAAVVTRLALLFSLFWLAHLEAPIPIKMPGGAGTFAITPRQIVLTIGGLFLIWTSLSEISAIFAARPIIKPGDVRPWHQTFVSTILQIALFDIVFSLDSVIAAIAIAQRVEVMAAAIVTGAFVLLFLVNPISNFIDRYKVVKLIALNFLTLVGSLLIAEVLGLTVPRVYFYEALAVAIAVQLLILWVRSQSPGARRVLTPLLVLLSLAAVVGAVAYRNEGTVAGDQAIATLMSIMQIGVELLTAAFNWVRSVL